MTHSVRNSLCELGILPPHPPRPPSARLDIPHPAPHSLLNPVTILRTLNMANITFTLNGTSRTVDVAPEMPLLWVLRDVIGLTGTKFGCGMSLCGACTVHVDAQPVRSCSTVMKSVAGKKVTTIEGLSDAGAHPMQRAWIEADVRSAATASRARSCRPRRCWPGRRTRLTATSTRRCAATCAAAAPISRSAKRFISRRSTRREGVHEHPGRTNRAPQLHQDRHRGRRWTADRPLPAKGLERIDRRGAVRPAGRNNSERVHPHRHG